MHDYNRNIFGMHFFWWVIWIVVVLLVVYIVSKQRTNTNKETALEILKKRLAKGEITKVEFEESKKVIKN